MVEDITEQQTLDMILPILDIPILRLSSQIMVINYKSIMN